MNTLEKLQQHLATKIFDIAGYEYKEQATKVVCKDGTTASVQASRYHYCKPRTNAGPYTHVEVWYVTAPVTEFFYDDEEPATYVQIELVAKFIDNHGGFKEE